MGVSRYRFWRIVEVSSAGVMYVAFVVSAAFASIPALVGMGAYLVNEHAGQCVAKEEQDTS
jgi:hypothetical protein